MGREARKIDWIVKKRSRNIKKRSNREGENEKETKGKE